MAENPTNTPLINAQIDPNFDPGANKAPSDTNTFDADSIISDIEQEIQESSDTDISSIISYPHTIMEVSNPKNVSSEFVYNKFTSDELTEEKLYTDANGEILVSNKQPRYVKVIWESKPNTFIMDNQDLDRLVQYIKSNNLDVDLVDKYIFVRHGKSNYLGNYSEIEDALDQADMSYSFTVNEIDEFAIMNRSNYLCAFDSSEDVDHVISKALSNISPIDSTVDLKNYLFESMMNYDESNIIVYDNFDFSNNFELDPATKSRFDYVGYIIVKERINSDGTIFRGYDPIIVLGADKSSYIDAMVSYGSTYKYRIASIGRISFNSVDSVGNNILVNIFVKSSFSIVPAIRCITDLVVNCPIDLRFIYNKAKKAVYVQWHSPNDKQSVIAGYILFTRKDLKFPYVIYRVHDNTPMGYDRSQVSGNTFSFNTNWDVQDDLVSNRKSSMWNLYSDLIPIKHGEKYYVAVMSYSVHNEISFYSEQYMISYDIYNGLDVRRISESNAPIEFPNYFIDKNFQGYDTIYDQVRKDIVVKNYDKMYITFKPIAEYLKNGQNMEKIFYSTNAIDFAGMAGTSNSVNRNYYKFSITDMDIKKTKYLVAAINKNSQ